MKKRLVLKKYFVLCTVAVFALMALPGSAQSAQPQPPAANSAPPAPPEPPYNQPQNQTKSKGKDYSVTCKDGHCTSNSPAAGSQTPYPSFPASALADHPTQTKAAQTKAPQASPSNAFPEAQSMAAQKAAEQVAPQPPVCTQPCSSSEQRMAGMDVLGKDSSPMDDGTGKPVFNPNLAKKDDQVGRFYLATENYVGAYSRFLEATEVNPGDAFAVFGLAKAEYNMGRKQQAIQNFKIYLSAMPKGHDAHEARKLLRELQGKH